MKNPFYENSKTLYRSRDGSLFGVCKGLSEWSETTVGLVRLAFVIGSFMFSPFIPLLYFILAIFMKPEPIVIPNSESDAEFYNSYSMDRKRALQRLKRKMDSLNRRTRRMESTVTEKEFDWERRFNSGI
jgi:phage shock protein C